jgi:uncharacterized protein (TIGR03086 family)
LLIMNGRSDPTTSADLPTDQLAAVLDDLDAVMSRVGDDQLAGPTPCSEFSVRDLEEHILRWLTSFGRGLADAEGQAPDPDGLKIAVPDLDGYRTAAAMVVDGFRKGPAERPLQMGTSMPRPMACALILWEYQVHGWDLARASGQSWNPDDAGLQHSLEFSAGMLAPEYRGAGKSFGDQIPVPDDAPPLDRLLGFSGRDPAWAPAG